MSGGPSKLRRRVSLSLATAAVAACLAPSGALAAAFEPNDSQATAFGPITGGKLYTAAIDRLEDSGAGIPPDDDWYVMDARRSGGTITVTYNNLDTAGNCFNAEARLINAAGTVVGTAQPPHEESAQINIPSGGPGRYFLHFRPYPIIPCRPPDSPYSFRVDGIGLNSNIQVTSAKLTAKRLLVAGTLAEDASASLIRVEANFKAKKGKRAATSAKKKGKVLRLQGQSAGAGKWAASGRLPKALRGRRSLPLTVTFLGDSLFEQDAVRSSAKK